MKTRFIKVFTFILVCFPGFLMAQQNVPRQADSLLAKLAKTTADTTRVNLLNDLSDVYYDNPAESKNYGEKALKLSEKIKWNKGRIASYNSLAAAASTANDYKASVGYAKLGLQISDQMNDRAGSGGFYFSIGESYKSMKDIPQAINAYNSALKYLPEKSPLSIITLNQVGKVYASLNNYEQAIDYYLRAKKIADKSDNVNTKSLASFFLRNMYANLREYKKALTYAFEFRKYAEQQNQKPVIYGALENIGYLYDNLKDFDNALVYYNKALAVATELNDPEYKAAAKAGAAWEYYQAGDYARAFPAAKESLDLPLPESDRHQTYHTLGNILRDAPDSLLQKYGIKPGDKYQQAINYFLRSNKSQNVNTRENNYRDMSIAYERMGKLGEAYESYKHYIAMRDSMDIAGHQSTVSQKEIQFDYVKREDSIKYAQNLTKEKLKQESLLATQQRQALLLNTQQLSLANKQKDIERLNYLKSQANLQSSQKDKVLAQATVSLQKAEISAKRYQSYYFMAGLAVLLLLAGFITLNYYNQRRSNRLLSEKQEEIITQRDRLTETVHELKSTQAQLIQSEKMASLGELTAGIAHEIQNPLNFVNNFSDVNREMMAELKEALKAGDMEEALTIAGDLELNEEKINHHGRRADFIVKGMLQHSRKSGGEKQVTSINTLADEFLKLSYHGLRAKDKSFNAETITHFKTGLPGVNIVQQDIGRVLLNLYNNAFYAVQQKQKTAGTDYKPVIKVSTCAKDGFVEVSINDNGIGIPDAIKEKILQPFFTTKPTGEGTGLGLSISYDIVVKAHGGKIDIKSVEGEFAEFSILLPQ